MTQKMLYPDWKEIVVYSEKGPKPQVLAENETYKCVMGGLVAGNSIPPHPEGPAVFHFLEGSGRMIVGEESCAFILTTQAASGGGIRFSFRRRDE